MVISIWAVLCAAYMTGLLCSGIGVSHLQLGSVRLPWAGLVVCGCFLLVLLIAASRWKLSSPLRDWKAWVGITGVSLLAMVYMAARSPLPAVNDVSTYVERAQAISPNHIMTGQVIDEPRLNRGLRGRFRLSVTQLQIADGHGDVTFQTPVGGRLYVTAPLLQITGLHAGQWVTVQGQLYLPQAAHNPGGFDFRTYLADQQTFAGLIAEELQFSEQPGWGIWQLRQRIVHTQLQALGSPLGQLVSAMALGRRAVDLPFTIQDMFSRVGLAHTIAASGFHVSLLLGTVLAIIKAYSGPVKLSVGLAVLGGYVLLTGLQASVVRAALMGVAALLGLALERQVKPLGALLVAVTLMLLVNPNWIWDVGFQLSVTATVGLIVMVPMLTQWLDWLPVTLSSLLAVPIAATLWTLPLMVYHFNVISGLSVGLNAIATPLVTIVSLGGISSSALALLSPTIGAAIASLMYYPAQGLLGLARLGSQLPGSAIALGQISIWQLVGLYGVLVLSMGRFQQFLIQRLLPVIFLTLLLLPMVWQLLNHYQITLLSAQGELVWVMQDHGRTTLLSGSREKTVLYTVLPFLQQAGINRIDTAIALSFNDENESLAGWQLLSQQIPSSTLYGDREALSTSGVSNQYQQLQPGQSTDIPSDLTLQLLGTENPILRLSTPQQSWLLLPPLPPTLQDHLAGAGSILNSQILVWDGAELSQALLNAVNPETAICYGRELPQFLERTLERAQIQVYSTARDGAITWRSHTGFQGYHNVHHRPSSHWS